MKGEFLFDKERYKWLLIGVALVAVGFGLMAGGGSEDPKVFNDAVFNFQRIRLAPTVVLFGYGVLIYAIFRKNNKA